MKDINEYFKKIEIVTKKEKTLLALCKKLKCQRDFYIGITQGKPAVIKNTEDFHLQECFNKRSYIKERNRQLDMFSKKEAQD